MNPEIRDCDFCGAEGVYNRILQGEPMIEFYDMPPGVSIPSTVLCEDCTQDVSDYLSARTTQPDQDVIGDSPFGEADAQALLGRLEANNHLVMELGRNSGNGIRAVDNEWKKVVPQLPFQPVVVTLSREEVRDLILEAKRLTVKRFDSAAWDGLEHC